MTSNLRKRPAPFHRQRPLPAGESRPLRAAMRRWAPLLLAAVAVSSGGLAATVASPAGAAADFSPEAQVSAYHARGEFDGVALVAEGGRVRYLGAFGPAGPGADAPALTPQTVFPICSITKQFTAVLILQLVDAGKLRLDSPLSETLPEFRDDAPGRSITVRQLLTHSSGLPDLGAVLPEVDGVEGFYRLQDLDFARPLTVLQAYLRGPLRMAPGERFAYNNADYWVLGAIIERLGGQPFETLLNERLLRPLGMKDTGLCTPARPLPADSARGRVSAPGGGGGGGAPAVPGPDLRLENFWAAGAMFSNAEDLLRWSVALDEGRLLSPAMQREMFTPDPKLGFVALSSWVYRASPPGAPGKVLLVERQGEIGAFHALSLRLPERHGHLLFLSNLDVADLNSTYMGKGLPFELVRSFLLTPPPAGAETGKPATGGR